MAKKIKKTATYLEKAKILKVKLLEIEQIFIGEEPEAEKKLPRGLGEKIYHFFLPHQHNGYQPGILHPKRIGFYALTVLALKIILVSTVISYPLEAMLTGDDSIRQKAKIFSLVNAQRQASGLAPLQDNSLLDHAAFLKAQGLSPVSETAALDSSLEPNRYLSEAGYDYSQVAANIADNFIDADELFAAWMKSDISKANLLDPDFSEAGIGLYLSSRNSVERIMAVMVLAGKKPAEKSIADNPSRLPEAMAGLSDENASTTDASYPVKPVITNLGPDNLTNQGKIGLDIFSPLADTITLYVDNNELMIKSIYASGLPDNTAVYQEEISLSEGQHSILVKSSRGKFELYSDNYLIYADFTPPALIGTKQIEISEAPKNGELTLEATALMSSDTERAYLLLGNYQVPLERNGTNANQLQGKFIIAGEDLKILPELKKQLILVAEDKAGNSIAIRQAAIGSSILDKYSQSNSVLRSGQNLIAALLASGMLFYKIMLLAALLMLLMNIFIEVHIQYKRIIFSTLGFICLLTIFILI